jgi:DNA-binding response OmpR family regulator
VVADDDPEIRALVARRLVRAGFRVAEAGTGAETLARVQEEPTEVVILDVMMPDGDGPWVAERLRERGERCAIVMLSARGMAGDLRRAYDAGADDYVIKPFDAADLLRRVGEAVASRRP